MDLRPRPDVTSIARGIVTTLERAEREKNERVLEALLTNAQRHIALVGKLLAGKGKHHERD